MERRLRRVENSRFRITGVWDAVDRGRVSVLFFLLLRVWTVTRPSCFSTVFPQGGRRSRSCERTQGETLRLAHARPGHAEDERNAGAFL